MGSPARLEMGTSAPTDGWLAPTPGRARRGQPRDMTTNLSLLTTRPASSGTARDGTARDGTGLGCTGLGCTGLGCAGLCREEGLAAAYAEHAPRLAARARRVVGDPHLADDAVQEAFIRAW